LHPVNPVKPVRYLLFGFVKLGKRKDSDRINRINRMDEEYMD
jgi:hypothetical protein